MGALSHCTILFIHGNVLEEGSKHFTSAHVQSQEQLESQIVGGFPPPNMMFQWPNFQNAAQCAWLLG